MKKMYIMRGASGSGKSTLAKKLWMLNLNSVILSTDELYNSPISGNDNPQYFWSANTLREAHAVNMEKARVACERGVETVIIDNTNTTWKEIQPYVETAIKHGYEIEIREPETSWKNDVKLLSKMNTHNVPEFVVEKQLGRFESSESIEMKILMLKGKEVMKPDCILVDLDGTLALFEGRRNPYDASRCDEIDEVNPAVLSVVEMCDEKRIAVILMSGRDSKYRPATVRWLQKHSIPYHALYMRAENDRRKDSLVKRDLFNENIAGKYNVKFVLDDRFQVIKEVWNKLGIFCFICNQELKEF